MLPCSFVNVELLNVVQRYLAAHPDVKVLDPIENVMRLSDRHQQYQFVKECDVVDESRFSRLYVHQPTSLPKCVMDR